MRNYVGPGNVLNLTAPSGGVTSGVGVLMGNIFGVSNVTAAEGETFALTVDGEVELAKTSALAISVGDILYWDDTNKVVNKTSSSQKPVGVATTAAANPSSTVRLKLTPNITAAA